MWERVARSSDLREGIILVSSRTNGKKVAITVIRGTVFAFSATCPHKGGPLNLGELRKGCKIRCPWHGYEFDLRTGRPTEIPYPSSYGEWRKTGNLRIYKVKLSKDDVMIDIGE